MLAPMTTLRRIAGRAIRSCHDDLTDLEPLRDHPSPGVQNRVADRLRHAARRRPELVAATCSRWLAESPSPATRRIVRRAMRATARPTR
jgi:3-methyladenine DNA glycosylase AlkC